MGTTTKWALRYPAGSDTPDVPRDIQYLATDLDGVAMDSQGLLAARPAATTAGRYYLATDDTTYSASGTLYRATGSVWLPVGAFPTAVVTALPGSPATGQSCILQTAAMATAKVRWHLQYNGTKWEFLGGSPLYHEVTTAETLTNAAYTALTTPGPLIAVPVAGDYTVGTGANVQPSSASANAQMSYDIGGTGAVDADRVQVYGSASAGDYSRSRIKTGLTAVTLTMKYKAPGGFNATWANRWMSLTPVLLG